MMLDKILFWVVLVWMVVLLVFAIKAVRDVWKEDSQSGANPDGGGESGASSSQSGGDGPTDAGIRG